MNYLEKSKLFRETVEEKNNRIKKFKEEQQDFIKNHFSNFMKLFFEACPSVKAVMWCQYTPYFNDGEPCVFGLGTISFIPKTEKEKETGVLETLEQEDEDPQNYYEEYGHEIWKDAEHTAKYSPEISLEEAKNLSELRILLTSLKEYLKTTFGDHTFIKCVCDGKVEITEYYHD
jgi:hypothetical protein